MADESKSALQAAYRRDLGQVRRLPRLMPTAAPSEPEAGMDQEDEEETDSEMPEDDFANDTDTAEEDETEEQEEEEAAEEDEDEAMEEEEAEEEDEAELGGSADSSKAQKEAVERLKKEATKKGEEAVVRLASKLKIAKIGAALTVVGIIVTYLIMTLQFIIGNCLKKEWMPKLSLFEIIVWALLTSLLVLVLAIALVILIILLAMSLGPIFALGLLGKELIGFIF